MLIVLGTSTYTVEAMINPKIIIYRAVSRALRGCRVRVVSDRGTRVKYPEGGNCWVACCCCSPLLPTNGIILLDILHSQMLIQILCHKRSVWRFMEHCRNRTSSIEKKEHFHVIVDVLLYFHWGEGSHIYHLGRVKDWNQS